jgi:hypothetical protein
LALQLDVPFRAISRTDTLTVAAVAVTEPPLSLAVRSAAYDPAEVAGRLV